MASLGTAVFSQVENLKAAEIAKGTDVITLNVGNSDLPPAPHIIEALEKAVADGSNYAYMLKSMPEFLKAIADWYKDNFEVTLNPSDEILPLLGSQEGLAHLPLCLINPGDVALVPDPGYPIFNVGPLVAGAELSRMPLTAANNYLPDLGAIDKNILKRAKIMILNYPNNPLAATAPREFLLDVVKFAKKHEILICYDFAYSHLTDDNYKPDSFLSLPGAMDVAIEFNSLSKTYCMAGGRVAFVAGNKNVLAMLAKLKSHFDYGIFRPLQIAAIAALTGPQDYVKKVAAIYQRRRKIMTDGLNSLGWNVEMPKAGMYVWAPIPTKEPSFDFVASMIKNTGVVTVPGSGFGEYGEGFIRIALVQPEERIQEAIRRIGGWLK
jgi:LL-diaminopimelate aminotransferase